MQGVQQIYISGLWYWGSQLSSYDSSGNPVAQASNTIISAVCFPVAVMLIALAVATFFGLPEYYRQTPGSIPSFFQSIFRRKLILVSASFHFHPPQLNTNPITPSASSSPS